MTVAMENDAITAEEWEKLCRGCGECCLEKIEDERGTIFYTLKPCRYLDIETRQCRIYDNRFVINPECVKLTPELVPTCAGCRGTAAMWRLRR